MNHSLIKDILCEIGALVCDKVHSSLRQQSTEELSTISEVGEDDTIYQIDKDVEEIIVPLLEAKASLLGGIVLIAEGIGSLEKPVLLPAGMTEEKAAIRIICDPIDGTRGIMYDKRAAFYLAGAAPNKGRQTSLQDIEVAVMTELPTSKAYQSDTFYAIKGKGAKGFSRNIFTGEIKPKVPAPSKASTLIGGFGQIARFFPPAKQILAAMEDELIEKISHGMKGSVIVFEDQYISSGGQLFEMLTGHDRFVAELREGLYARLGREGKKGGHCCHPYDLCAHLIGTEAGIVITGRNGKELNALLDTTSPVDWIAYANESIRNEIEPVLKELIRKYQIL
jgi:fructose-1,6-bisphosphatase/inositol monophosphatase family enzyme